MVTVDLYCAWCPLEWVFFQGHCAIHEEPLINAWGCNQGLLWFTGASVTNSLYCVTWFNGHTSGRPSTRLPQHLHHRMTVGSVLCRDNHICTYIARLSLPLRMHSELKWMHFWDFVLQRRTLLLPDVNNAIQCLRFLYILHTFQFIDFAVDGEGNA